MWAEKSNKVHIIIKWVKSKANKPWHDCGSARPGPAHSLPQCEGHGLFLLSALLHEKEEQLSLSSQDLFSQPPFLGLAQNGTKITPRLLGIRGLGSNYYFPGLLGPTMPIGPRAKLRTRRPITTGCLVRKSEEEAGEAEGLCGFSGKVEMGGGEGIDASLKSLQVSSL